MGCLKLTYHQDNTNASNLRVAYKSDCKNQRNPETKTSEKLRGDYLVGGMIEPGRNSSPSSYRFGYQGSEKDDEITSVPNANFTTFFREGDTRTMRWWTTDPEQDQFPDISPYVSMDNNPILKNDPDGGIWDIVADIAFILYDAGEIAYDYATKGEVSAVSVAALSADVTCAVVPFATGGGLVVRAGKASVKAAEHAAPKIAKETAEGVGEKTYQTYTKKNVKTGEVYSGRTSGKGTPQENILNRDKKPDHQAKNKSGYGPAKLDKSSTNPDAIRGREQQLIKKHGGAKSQGGTSGNKINSVSDKNPNKGKYESAAKKEFKK